MNNNRYRLVFNKTRGMLMAVAECANSMRKSASGETAGSAAAGAQSVVVTLRPVAWTILLALGAVQIAGAQIVPDHAGGRGPGVGAAPNGTPLVNINAPSGAGVSHNQYQQLSVDGRGAILNNATGTTQTQLGGYIPGNANLGASGPARVILNEVIGAHPSRLNGYVEVAGQRADVVISNGNGISINGGGFINANRATITTGTPVFGGDGSLAAFRVTRGGIQLEGQGFNGTSLDQVDLIARSVTFNGALWANTANVIAGANQVDYASLGVQVIQGDGNRPTVGIDVASLGGMYANRIRLLGTEGGVGVRSAGTLAAQAGDFTIDSAGQISLAGTTSSTGSLLIRGAQGVDNRGSTAARTTLTATSEGTIVNSGALVAGNDLALAGQSVQSTGTLAAGIDAGGNMTQAGNLTLRAAQSVAANGQNLAGTRLDASGGTVSLAGSQTRANGDIALEAHSGDLDLSNSTLGAGQAIKADAAGMLRTDGVKASAARLSASAQSLSNRGGALYAKDGARVAVRGDADNTGGDILTDAGILDVSAQGALVNANGRIVNAGTGETMLRAARVENSNRGQAAGAGTIGGNGTLTLSADVLTNIDGGQLVAGTDLTLQLAQAGNNSGGRIQAGTQLSLRGDQAAWRNDGGTLSASAIDFDGATLSNRQGSVLANGALHARFTGDVDNTGGTLQAGDTLELNSNGTVTNDAGQIANTGTGSTDIRATAIRNLNGATLGGNGSVSLTAQSLANTQAARIVGGTDVALHLGQSVDNAGGRIHAGRQLSSEGSGAAWRNDGGTISAKTVQLTGASLSNRQGSVLADEALNLTLLGNVDNNGGTIQGGQSLTVAASGVVANDAGEITNSGTGDTAITAATVANTNGALLGGNGALAVTADELFNTGAAQLVGGKDVSLRIGRAADNSGGNIYAGQHLSIEASQAAWRNDAGTLSGKSLDFASRSLSNRHGTLLAEDDLDATVGGDVDNGNGTVQAGKTLAVNAAGHLANDAGQVISTGTGNTSVAAASVNNTNGAMLGGNGDVALRVQHLANTAGAQLVSGRALLADIGQGFNNAGGKVFGGTGLGITGSQALLANAGGTLASGGSSTVQVGSLDNQAGKLIADRDIALDTGAMIGVGTVHAGQDLRVSVQSDYTNAAGNQLKAERNLEFRAGGTFENRTRLEAVNALTLTANRIFNEAGAVVNASNTTLNAAANIANSGRIEGDHLEMHGDVLTNTATMIGGVVTAKAREVNNVGAAAIMAATDTLNVFGRDQVSNTGGATLYTLGDLNIAADGERDDRGLLRNRSGQILNDSSTIEGGSSYSVVEIAAQNVLNQRPAPTVISDTTVETKHELKREKYIHCATGNAYPQMGCTQEVWEGPYKKPIDATFSASQIVSRDDANKRVVVEINGVATQIDYNTLTESGGAISLNYWDGYNRDIHYDPGTEYETRNDGPRGWQRVEIARDTTTTTTTERDANPGQPGANLISGGDMILANVGSLENRYSTVAAGGNMLIGDQAQNGEVATGQYGTTKLTNIGQTLYQRATQEIVSTYAWNKDTNQAVGPVAQPTVVKTPVAVGKIGGTITAGTRLTVYGGEIHNEDVGRADPMAGTGSTTVTGASGTTAPSVKGGTGGRTEGSITGATAEAPTAIARGTLANVPISLPSNGLYTYHSEPGYTYLIETDSRFTNYGNFVSSDYMLGLLGIDPAMTQKRLGDGFFEQKLIRDQVTQLTGRVHLAGYDSAEEQYKALMAAGVNAAKEFNILPGMALTAAQMDALTTDIVWLVSETVTLPDGSTQEVLVPRIYLSRAHAADLQPNGTLIAADDIELHSAGTMKNSGVIDAGSRLSIAAKEDVVNRGGAIRSQGVTAISAGRDIVNQSGQISGDKVGLVAGRDIQNVTLFDQQGIQSAAGNSKASTSLYGQQASIQSSGDMLISAGRDVTASGSNIAAGGNAIVIAGRDLTFDTLAGKTQQSVYNSDKHHSADSRTEHAVSTVKTGGSLTTTSGGDTILKGTDVQSGTDLTMVAGGDLAIAAVTNETTHDNVARQTKRRQLEEHSRDQTTVGASLTAGGNATLAAVKAADQGGGIDRADGKGNVTVTGATITAGSDGKGNGVLTVVADRDVTIGEARELHDSSLDIQRKGGSFVSRSSSSLQTSSHADLGVGSTLSGDSVAVRAGNDLTVRQSAVAGTEGVALTATEGNVLITAGQNMREDSASRQQKKSGISAFAGQGGIGLTVGSSSASGASHTLAITQSDARSVIGASNGNVTITAGKDATIIGSDLVAGRTADSANAAAGNIDILAENVTIAEGIDRISQSSSASSKSSGITVALVGTPYDTARNLKAAQENSSGVSRTMQTMRELGASALTVPQIAVSIGSNKSSSQSSSEATVSSGSSLTGAGDIRVRAKGNGQTDADGKALDGNILVSGSNINAGGAAILDAARDVTLRASTDSYTEANSASSSGWKFNNAVPSLGDVARHLGGGPNNSGVGMVPYGSQKANASGDIASSKQNASVVTGNTVAVTARTGDITIAGSGIASEGDAALSAAKGKIDILSGQDTLSQRSDSSSRQIGDLGGSGYSGTIGVRSESHHIDTNQATQNTIRSQVVSNGGNVTIVAKDDITARGADIAAGNDVTMIGKNVVLDPGVDAASQNESHRVSQYGTTLALSGYTVTAAQALENAARAVEENKDSRVATLYGVQAGLAIANGIAGIQAVTSGGVSSTAAIKVTASIGGGSQSSESHSQSSSHQGSTVKAGNAVTIVATGSGGKDADGYAVDGDITGHGAHIEGKTVNLSAARDVNLESAQDHSSLDSRSRGSNASIGVGVGIGGDQNGFTLELAASQNKAKANGESVTHQNSHVVGTDKVSVTSGRDTNLKGAQLIGDTVEGTIGRDLNIESRQDTETYHSRESSSGMQASVCVPPFCYGTAVHASGSVTQGNTDSTYRSVQEQSGIYAGQGGFDVNVKGNTDLKGGIVASTAEFNKNRLTTGTLTSSDIENKAEYSSSTSTIVGSYSGGKSVAASDPNLGPVQPAHVEWAGNTNLLQGAANSLAATAAGNAQRSIDGNAAGITKSAIAAGTVVVTDDTGQQTKTGKSADETVAELNRDTANANQSIDKIFDAQKVKDQQELNRLKSEVAQQLAPMVYQQVGDVLVGASPETKAAVHALVGGLMSQALGGSFAAGAAGGAAASLAMEAFGQTLLEQKDLSEADRKALVQLAGAIVGGAAGAAAGGSTADAAAGANVGKVATENNYLNHAQTDALAKELKACKGDPNCVKDTVTKYKDIDQEQRADVQSCSDPGVCKDISFEARGGGSFDRSDAVALCAGVPSCETFLMQIGSANTTDQFSAMRRAEQVAIAAENAVTKGTLVESLDTTLASGGSFGAGGSTVAGATKGRPPSNASADHTGAKQGRVGELTELFDRANPRSDINLNGRTYTATSQSNKAGTTKVFDTSELSDAQIASQAQSFVRDLTGGIPLTPKGNPPRVWTATMSDGTIVNLRSVSSSVVDASGARARWTVDIINSPSIKSSSARPRVEIKFK
ncbi:filamentous hemagglutinin outer membrane protein [Cupriavidus sp. HPC(L)]|uniref:hemagglutinin repeat-containing protein n=1 Tax=Cupriavidus sp. HPC(L) TaxID=1217418 RepID=UPI0003BEBDF3|nr:hemagglutinin repeat-containing protein [Cupriavidus sp. HPC(L)]ESH86953.1 filamentous hemagglutinin outer membrane protein [Cupriavidus sp. HPC(L)]